MQTTTPSTRIGRILLALLILTLSPLAWTHSSPLDIQTAHAQGGPVNIITNADFEGGVFTDSRGFQVPDNWSFETCEGVENATVDLDNSQWADGVNSTRVDTGPIRNTGCLGPNMRQTANCTGSSQTSLDCNFSFPLIAQSILAFCMGMSGTGNTLSVSDTQGNAFSIKQEVNTNVHIACGYSTTYTSSGSDLVTLTFQSNTFTDFAVVYDVAPDSTNHQITVAPVSDSGPCTGTGSGLNLACDTQVAASGPPFIFSMAASTTPMGTYSAGNNFVKTTIAATGNAQYSNSSLVANTSCMSSGTNSVSYGVVCVFLRNARFSNRTVGFSQFRQSTQGVGYNITQLTDDPAGFSFWFKLQPDNSNGMAGFEIRIFGAEALAELDYAINPDPSVGMFQNNTSTHSLLFYGYQPGQWYHFSRNLRADWMRPMGPGNMALALDHNFTLVQFEGLAIGSGTTAKAETFWLDDVRAYVGTGQPPVGALFPENSVPNGNLTFNNPVNSLQITQQDNKALTFKVQGIIGVTYSITADVPVKPTLIQLNGYDLAQDFNWKYYPSQATITLTASTNGDTFSLYFEQPQRLPTVQFVDATGFSVDNKVTFRILDPAGNQIQYSYGRTVPDGNYLLEAYYDGFQVYKAPL